MIEISGEGTMGPQYRNQIGRYKPCSTAKFAIEIFGEGTMSPRYHNQVGREVCVTAIEISGEGATSLQYCNQVGHYEPCSTAKFA